MTSTRGTTSQKTTKLGIPHPHEKGCVIAGILEQVAAERPTHGRKIALILHGSLGHKDYIYQKRLAHRLPLDSFRFDFRGNHETPGPWFYGTLDNDLQDVDVVVEYLTKELGYIVDMLVGHSRGMSRYRMEKIYDEMEAHKDELNFRGYVFLSTTVARKLFTAKLTRKDYDAFASNDTSVIWGQFPKHIEVLTIHGLKDAVAPPYDAIIYARAYEARSLGAHTLHFVEDADHNFTGVREEVVNTVIQWLQQRNHREARTGLWITGLKGKL